MGIRALLGSVSAIALALTLAVPTSANQDLGGSFSGGAVSGNAILNSKGSAYSITSPIDIPAGATLTINPGVEISSQTSTLFRVQGSLVIAGTSDKPVIIRVSDGFVQTIALGNGDDAQNVDISFAHITGGRSFEINAKSFSLRDSEIVSQKTCGFGSLNTVKVSSASTVFARNYFKSICGFDFNVSFGVFGPRGTFNVENNHFAGNSLSSYWLAASALRKDTMTLRGNTFFGATSKVLATGFFKTSVFANDNYWGSLSLPQVRALVEGSVADTFNPASVTLETLLSAPNPQTPASQRLVSEITPTPTPTPTPTSTPTSTPTPTPNPAAKKYKNCSELNKVYKGGVARTSNWVNKGAKLKQTPIVNSKVYDLNKSLDRDKDGLACEG